MFFPVIELNACNSDEICVDVFPGNHVFEFARCVKKERYVRIAQLMLERSARANLRADAEEEQLVDQVGQLGLE